MTSNGNNYDKKDNKFKDQNNVLSHTPKAPLFQILDILV